MSWFLPNAVIFRIFLMISKKNTFFPGNSVDTERSVSQYAIVISPQYQNVTDENLTLQVMMVVNARKWLWDFELVCFLL